MLTDQVEAQGAKISDLQSSLVEHQQKLNSTEEMLQQVHSFTYLTSKHPPLDNTKSFKCNWTKVRNTHVDSYKNIILLFSERASLRLAFQIRLCGFLGLNLFS